MANDDSAMADLIRQLDAVEVDEQPRGFLKLPAELRVKIYELVLLPPPVPRIECCGSPNMKLCTPGGRLLASTCKPKPSRIRAFACSSCEWRGADVHTDILAVNRQVHSEAIAVLYEHTSIVARQNSANFHQDTLADACLFYTINESARRHIKNMQLCVEWDRYNDPYDKTLYIMEEWHRRMEWFVAAVTENFSGIKHVTIHFDVDLTACAPLDARPFEPLCSWHDMDFSVEVHIFRAWDDTDEDWQDAIERRPRDTVLAKRLNDAAEQLRATFVRDLNLIFEAKGEKLKMREE